MDDKDHDLVLGIFALAIAAVLLVAGELYLVTRPDGPEASKKPASTNERPTSGFPAEP
jgi:hypothetical protein